MGLKAPIGDVVSMEHLDTGYETYHALRTYGFRSHTNSLSSPSS